MAAVNALDSSFRSKRVLLMESVLAGMKRSWYLVGVFSWLEGGLRVEFESWWDAAGWKVWLNWFDAGVAAKFVKGVVVDDRAVSAGDVAAEAVVI